MDSLKNLTSKFGEPDALIDHWDSKSKRMAIWGFDETFIYSNNGCYLNGKKIEGSPLELCNKVLNAWDLSNSASIHAIGYISYDIKNDLFPHLKLKKVNNQTLIWFGKPKLVKEYNLENEIVLEDLNNHDDFLITKEIPNIDTYKKSIKKIRRYLKLGETYQINYSNPREYSYKGSIFNLYLHLRNIAKPKNGFYLNTGTEQLLSVSPERFFEVKNNIISTYPIKGTIQRSEDSVEDKKLYEELRHSRKDRAEHLMIVDLLRNDLGKICKYGTVKTENLYKIKSFETIHHMESEINGELIKNISFKNIIEALFPGGSITGAPKERAIEIIDEIENYNRGIYTGTIGYLSSGGYMNFNIAIRTLSLNSQKAIYPVGGGIVWDSTAEDERVEALNKGKIIDKMVTNIINEYA